MTLAFALSFLLLLGWSYFVRTQSPPVQPEPTDIPAVEQPDAAGAENRGEGIAPPAGQPVATVAVAPFSGSAGQGFGQGAGERLITLESDVAQVTFSTRGAVVRSWTLSDYRDSEGEPLELIHGDDTGLGFPFDLSLGDEELQEALGQAVFVARIGGTEALGTLPADTEVAFEWSGAAGSRSLDVRKRFTLRDGYLAEIVTEVWVAGAPVPHQISWRGGFGDLHLSGETFEPMFLLRREDGLQRVGVKAALQVTGWIFKADPQLVSFSGTAAYAGMEDRYFSVLFIPPGLALEIQTESGDGIVDGVHGGDSAVESSSDETETEEAPAARGLGGFTLRLPAEAENRFQLFVGPKKIDILERVEVPGFSADLPVELPGEIVDFGWFQVVARPLLWAMQWIYDNVAGNYGWAIILLTILINLVMFPLKYKSSQQAWRMQKVAPQVKALQDKSKKYKINDPKRQETQQDVMALYRREGVNPLGGCLPMLIQLPFFIGFYRVLYSSIELRQAPWMGWIQDLSQRDPYFLLPIVMTATMYLSTMITPMTTADPSQQRMMKMMPLLFGFMFLNFPSGLVLYWLSSNVVGVGQQWWINERHKVYLEAEKQAAKELKKQKRKKHAKD